MVQNLDAIGVKAHVDEQSITNEEYEDQLCKEGTYQIFICYCTSGMASQTSCYYYFIDNTLDGNWGTCDLPEFVEAYETRRQASDEKAYIEGTKLLPADQCGAVHRGSPLLGQGVLSLPHGQIRGVDELSRLGRDQLRDLV